MSLRLSQTHANSYCPDATKSSKSATSHSLLDVYRCAASHPWKFFSTILFSFLRGAELPIAGVLSRLLFNLFDERHENEALAVGQACALYAGLGLFVWLTITLATCFAGWTADCVINEVQVLAFRTQLDEDAAYFDNPETSPSEVIHKLSRDANNAKSGLDGHFVMVVSSLAAVVLSISIALAICWQIGLIALGLCVMLLVVFYILSFLEYRLTTRLTNLDDSAQIAREIIEQTRIIQLQTAENAFIQKCNRSLNLHKNYSMKIVIPEALGYSTAQAYIFVPEMIALVVGIELVYNGFKRSDEVFMATLLTSMAGWATAFASPAFVNLIRAAPAASSLARLVRDKPNFNHCKGNQSEIAGAIKVDDVSFAYPKRPTVKAIDGLTLRAGRGETIALVGSSGSGKTTVIQLLERFYAYQAGKIYLDEHQLDEISLSHLRSSMALVGQEPVLFRGSVFDNISLGVANATLEMVREACRQANAAAFVEALPAGYYTDVGDKGHCLSGGQKQRIAIARALIRNPKILLLDEATSALDAESEQVVEETLHSAAAGRTSIKVAHRLFTVQRADRIYVIKAGRVIEEGTHEELLTLNGEYRQMVVMQDLAK